MVGDTVGGILLAVLIVFALFELVKDSIEVPPYRPSTPPKHGLRPTRPAPPGAPDERGRMQRADSKRRVVPMMPVRPERFRADWYPDPDDSTKVRYWDGRLWTDHVEVRDPLLTPDNTTAPSQRRPGGPVPLRSKLLATAWLITPVLAFFLPLVGPWASAGAAYLAVGRARTALWTGMGWPRSRGSAVIAGFAALWLPPFLGLVAGLGGLFGPYQPLFLPGSAGWLFIPLMGPEDHLTPAAVALVVYAVGAAISASRRRPWPWIAGGVAANVAYDLTLVVADIGFIA